MIDDCKQVIKSSGSIGENYIEANEKLGEKDLLFSLKISRKEAKVRVYWLRLLEDTVEEHKKSEVQLLKQEATELRKILSTIIDKLNRA